MQYNDNNLMSTNNIKMALNFLKRKKWKEIERLRSSVYTVCEQTIQQSLAYTAIIVQITSLYFIELQVEYKATGGGWLLNNRIIIQVLQLTYRSPYFQKCHSRCLGFSTTAVFSSEFFHTSR